MHIYIHSRNKGELRHVLRTAQHSLRKKCENRSRRQIRRSAAVATVFCKRFVKGIQAQGANSEKKMKIAVLGATGPTGVQVVKQALEKGYEVRALVRDPDKMSAQVQHEKLQIHKIDLSQVEDLAGPMNGVDAVVSSLGGRGGIWTPCSIYTDSIVTIVTAMRQAGVKRLVCVTSWGAKDEEGLPWVISWFLKPTFLRNVLADMGRMEDFVSEQCSDIVYTVVRPPGLNNQPISEKEILTREGQYVTDCGHSVSRADVARFILDCLTTDAHNNKLVAIGVAK